MNTWRTSLVWRQLFLKQHIHQRWISTVYTSSKKLHEALGLKPGATKQEVKDAYIKLSKEYHPDRNKDKEGAQERFIQVNEAYTQLMKSLGSTDPVSEIPEEYRANIYYSYYHEIGFTKESLKYDPIRKKSVHKRMNRMGEYDLWWRKVMDSLFKSNVFLGIVCLLFLYKGFSYLSRETEQSKQTDASDLIAESRHRKQERDRIAKEERERREFNKKWNIKS